MSKFTARKCSADLQQSRGMDKEPLISYIQSIRPVAASSLVQITAAYEPRSLAKSDYFLKAGKPSNEYLFLTEGAMRSFTSDVDGNDVTTGFYGPNSVVMEVASFFTRTVSSETIQALTDCRGYVITFERVNELFHALPDFREFGRAMLVREFAAFKQRSLAMINQTADERYAALFAANPGLFQYAQVRHVASYLGITDTSLSRIRRKK